MFPIQTSIPLRHVPLVIWFLIALNTVAFLFEIQLPAKYLEQVAYLFGVVPARFTHPHWAAGVGFPVHDYWPLVTSLFLHGGWFHLIGNMWTLWLFGANVEDQMGMVRFFIFYLLCGICSGIVHLLVNANSAIPAIGASGAIAGVMGAYLMMFPLSRIVVMIPIFIFPFFFNFLAFFYLIYWFFLQFLSGTATITTFKEGGGIAFWAHVGGFLAGAILYRFFLRPRKDRRPLPLDEGMIRRAWAGGR